MKTEPAVNEFNYQQDLFILCEFERIIHCAESYLGWKKVYECIYIYSVLKINLRGQKSMN